MAKKHTDQIREGVKGLIKDVKDKARKVVREARYDAYRVVGDVERRVVERKGLIGGIADFVEEAVEAGKAVRKDIQAQGGIVGVASKIRSDVVNVATRTYESIVASYRGVEAKLFTDGQLDDKKVQQLLRGTASATKLYGVKTVNLLTEMAARGATAVGGNYRSLVPSPEELKTRYAGIAARYEGMLLRPDLEKCLTFYEKARRQLPGGLKSRAEILNDIKASASTKPNEILDFYRRLDTVETRTRAAVVVKYLK